MRILCKRRLCFSLLDGRRCVVEPFAMQAVPDWVTKTKMWEFAMKEDGLIAVLSESPQGVGLDEAAAKPAKTKTKGKTKTKEEEKPAAEPEADKEPEAGKEPEQEAGKNPED